MTLFFIGTLVWILICNIISTADADATASIGNALDVKKPMDQTLGMKNDGNLSCVTQSSFVTTQAVVIFDDTRTNVFGTIKFDQVDGKGPVRVNGAIVGLKPGLHGFHVHESGNIGESCAGAGAHFGSDKADHGAPFDQNRHIGDLGNILAGVNGVAIVDFHDNVISLNGDEFNVIGRAVVVHEDVDDLGRGNATDSRTTGHAGKRLACGVIGLMAQEKIHLLR